MSNTIGLYIHTPFCNNKCPYCDFFSGKGTKNDYDEYVKKLIKKIKYWSKQTEKNVATIYFGGGTPSVLTTNRLALLLSKISESFKICDDCEVTVEINPESGKNLDFFTLKKAGFNRISMGLQSANSNELYSLGRIHSADDAMTTVQKAKYAGFNNISLDLMLGIPHQTKQSLKKSIDFCNSCGAEHISSYILKIEKGTKFYLNKDNLLLPDEDMQAELYLFAVDYLQRLGYEQYEISNFARVGFESRHNINYWKCGEYIGIGPSAHSFLGGKRFCYGRSFDDFYNNIIIQDGNGGDKEEFIMLSLRLKSGLNLKEYKNLFGKPIDCKTMGKIKNYVNAEFMETDGVSVWFTPKGFLVSNSIISDLI